MAKYPAKFRKTQCSFNRLFEEQAKLQGPAETCI